MRVYAVFLVVVCYFLCPLCAGDDPKPDNASSSSIDKNKVAQMAAGEQRLGDQIRAILKHYQQDDPVGLPGAPIPDPMPVPDMKHSFSIYTMHFKQINVYGLSKFRIEHVESELARMQVSVSVKIDGLDIRGLYTLASWLSKSAGDFTVKLSGVSVQGIARLEVGTDGKLQAQNIDMDLTFDKIDLDFKNLGFLGSVFQGVINSIGTFMFDSIKPFILKEVNTNVRGEVNKQISQLPQYFPNSISPFDMAVAEARRQVRAMGYDPYRVPDYTQSAGIFTVISSHTWITGLASFYRMGNITITMQKGNVYALLDVGTQELKGKTHWEMSVIGGVLSRAGTVSFTVQYFRVQMKLSQPLDTRKRASLEELELELGNIQTRIHGAGTLDYLVEASVNILPNLLRYQIMDAIEGPLKRRIQEELNKIDVEKLIDDKIPEIEEQARWMHGLMPAEETILETSTPPQDQDSQVPFSDSEENRGPS
ncbi:uncharacterized protein LOC116849812 [Odontomachus brunneus]|uniref:uncharacterized protein LOC116849812 n=1 Tax=Odontomachus brunneus TaxID=486640 RepID=UPI0013F1869D|nr:uncharacterized protein LOC116849812 [Odontomachus brunneus]XP_032683271.1 uncharacterized protein LOC116849812 [Odontomachus brunneus]XP_032683280.1 uncharacterized protein LOC116849812 [Odontomachus brunneus]XP_032683288.1 uncharacterized protein LOC116849812 [Odontomachus brunneus]XP_032683297.1 uncharacterized protein LOC116849812 [Odontomachus brunneus]XP_032683305.1 uncharacterized protein LOC116849812 [Odontomachus brunneus]XP_032683315.1 uncharacterized protein LOC116849812 [Odonto